MERRAAWLTLLPFALGNLSYWARPELDVDAGTRKATAIVVRVALLLTLLLIAGLCLVGIDLVAWQCFRAGRWCPSLPSVLQFLDRPPWDTQPGGCWSDPAAAARPGWTVVPIPAVHESLRGRVTSTGGPVAEVQGSEPQADVERQRPHPSPATAASRGRVAVVVGSGVPVAEFGGTSHQLGLAVTGISAVLIGLLGIVAVGMSYEDGIDFPGRVEQTGWARRTACRISQFVGWVVLALLAAYGYLLFTSGPLESAAQAGPLRGHNLVVGGLLFLLVACVAWLVFASDRPWLALLLRRHCSESRSVRSWNGGRW